MGVNRYGEIKEGIKEGIKQGLTEGRIEEARELLIEALDVRFTPIPKQVAERIRRIDEVERLRSLFRKAILCKHLDGLGEGAKSKT